MKRDYTLLIGACGWRHPGWQAHFYPEDLPGDWQLDFYANAWPVVAITARERADATPWLDDGNDSLRFIGQWSWQDSPQAAGERQALGERYLAHLLRVDACRQPDELARQLAAWQDDGTLVVDFAGEPSAEVCQWLAGQGIGWCWPGRGDAGGLNHGPVAVARVMAQDRDARQLRGLVETCLESGRQARERILLFDGSPPDLEAMHNAEVIASLL